MGGLDQRNDVLRFHNQTGLWGRAARAGGRDETESENRAGRDDFHDPPTLQPVISMTPPAAPGSESFVMPEWGRTRWSHACNTGTIARDEQWRSGWGAFSISPGRRGF